MPLATCRSARKGPSAASAVVTRRHEKAIQAIGFMRFMVFSVKKGATSNFWSRPYFSCYVLRTIRQLCDDLAAHLTEHQAFRQVAAALIHKLQRRSDFTHGVEPLDRFHIPIKNFTLGVAGQTALRVRTTGHQRARIERAFVHGLQRTLNAPELIFTLGAAFVIVLHFVDKVFRYETSGVVLRLTDLLGKFFEGIGLQNPALANRIAVVGRTVVNELIPRCRNTKADDRFARADPL